MGKITLTLLGLTLVAFVSTITSVKASELDSFRAATGPSIKTYKESEVVAALSKGSTCITNGNSVLFHSKNVTKKQCRLGKQFLNVIKFKELDANVQKKLLGL